MAPQDVRFDVAVIGAAGQTGRPLVRALARRGAKVMAMVRRPEQAEQAPDAAAVIAVELEDKAGLTAALGRVAVAYYIPPVFNPQEERFGSNVISAALGANLSRLVYHSVLHAPTPSMPHHQRKAMVELALRGSSLAWTLVQPAMYAQTPLAFLNAARTHLVVGFDPNKLFTPVDLADLAEAVASILLDAGHEYATYELAGAGRISFNGMAAAMSDVLGREVAVTVLPSDVVANAAATRFGPDAVPALKAMLDHYDTHGLVGNPNILRMLLGREPLPFAETMRRELGGVA
jgi:uncharacterized protein YbjT (DUF2867 family)